MLLLSEFKFKDQGQDGNSIFFPYPSNGVFSVYCWFIYFYFYFLAFIVVLLSSPFYLAVILSFMIPVYRAGIIWTSVTPLTIQHTSKLWVIGGWWGGPGQEVNRRHRNENMIWACYLQVLQDLIGTWHKFSKFLLRNHLYNHSVTYRGKKGREGSIIWIFWSFCIFQFFRSLTGIITIYEQWGNGSLKKSKAPFP